MKLYFDNLIVAEFTDREVENLKGKLLTLSGLFKNEEMTDWNEFMYYYPLENMQDILNKLHDLLKVPPFGNKANIITIKNLSLELGRKPSDF